ncbi:MAG: hypothetical protein R3F34_05415 [Planctomycetota bacterium]
MNSARPILLATLVSSALALPAAAQWSNDPTSNLALADTANEEAQPKQAQRPGGGCYVSWFHSDPSGSPAFGYDVYLQRLDADGNELWPHGGVLVADRGFSSTQDYGLDVDANGDALLTFRDDRLGGVQITATKVDASGSEVWGTGGVQLTNTTNFLAAPKIAATSDGAVVVAWTQDSTTHVQRLDGSTGAATWANDVVLTPTSGNYGASDLHASNNGSVILALQKSGSFAAPRHLHAQKLSSTGAPLWGASPLVVFDGGSLQFGNFPTFITDGGAGAVFGWYTSSPALECRAQRVTGNGTEVFAHNGVAASTNAAFDRVDPWVGYDPATRAVYLVYEELSLSTSGISAQKFDVAGVRQWTNNGVALVGQDSEEHTNARGVLRGTELAAFWVASPGFGQDRVESLRVDTNGAAIGSVLGVATASTEKFRLSSALAADGDAVLVWQDGGSSEDVRAQNVTAHGTLGLPLTIDGDTLSLATGGTRTMSIDGGPDRAGFLYFVVGTTAGTSPGFDLGSVHVPLSDDGPGGYLLWSIYNFNSGLLSNSLGLLDGAGQGTATFNLPAGANAMVGTVVHHAAGLFDLGSGFAVLETMTNPVGFELVP